MDLEKQTSCLAPKSQSNSESVSVKYNCVTGKPARIMADKPVAPLCFADSLCERRDLVVRHPARPIPLYLNPCDGPHASTAKAVAFCERGKPEYPPAMHSNVIKE